MVRTKDGDGVKSSMIIAEVKRRPCLFDTNDSSYGDRGEKSRCWEEVCDSVVPGWSALTPTEKFTAGKEVQKRWRSIRDSYTKMYRQGKCVPAEQCAPGSRRYNYHRELAFLKQALMNKKPRLSQDKYDSYSEVSNSPQHPPPEEKDTSPPRVKPEPIDKTLDKSSDKPLDMTSDVSQVWPSKKTSQPSSRAPKTLDKGCQVCLDTQSFAIKIDANTVMPDANFDDDQLFMNSLVPLFKKMNDDTRLLCRIEVLKILRRALHRNECYEALRVVEESCCKDRMSGILKQEVLENKGEGKSDSKLNMTTRSADGSRPVKKRRARSPTPLPMPVKKRGPGRPRKVRPPPSDSDEEAPRGRPRLKASPVPRATEPSPDMDDSLSKATSVDQLSAPVFMKMYNLARTEVARPSPFVPIKIEPATEPNTTIEVNKHY